MVIGWIRSYKKLVVISKRCRYNLVGGNQKKLTKNQNIFKMQNFSQLLILFVIPCLSMAQIEDFEGEPLGGTSFTTNTTLFTMTGDLIISEFTNFSCSGNTGTNRYMDTGYQNGASSGVIGTFAPPMGEAFQVSTSIAQCGWPGASDGDATTTGTIRFTGTKLDNTTISEDFTLTSSNFTTLVPFTFSAATWSGIYLKSMQLEIISGMDYWAMDNLVFETVVLPVELLSFKGKSNKNQIKLTWLTASELNNEKFEIEERQDGREFQKIGEVKGNGTTLEQQEYSFEVKNPRSGISYYRLKQIDFDGQFKYSEVISVNFRGDNGDVGEFYPNPSKSGMVNLDYSAQNDDEITVFVIDMTGKLVVNLIQQVTNGDNNLSFDFSDLNTGIYIVKIGDEANPTHRKLIIEK